MKLNWTVAILLFLSIYSFGRPGDRLFDSTFVHEIRIEFSEPNFWDTLLVYYDEMSVFEPFSDKSKKYLQANISIDGKQIHYVGVRIKGFFSSWGTQGKKKPLKVDLDEILTYNEYDGISKFNLANSFEDPTCMRDMLALNILRQQGVPAPRTSYAKVFLNGQYWGLYVIVEQIDKTFLKQYFSNNDGNLYKSINSTSLIYYSDIPADYQTEIELKTNEEINDWSDFIELIRIINKIDISDEDYNEYLPEIFDIESFFKVLVVDAILLNWDSYILNGRNFYLYHNPDNKKFTWIPWDYNLSFSTNYFNILFTDLTETKPLLKNILKNPDFLKLYINTFNNLFQNNFTEERLFKIIDDTKTLIKNDLEKDSNKFYSLEAFTISLEKDSTFTLFGEWEESYNIDSVYFVNWNEGVPYYIWTTNKVLIDTSNCIRVYYDTTYLDTIRIVHVHCVHSIETQTYITGLKPFITKRVYEVQEEIKKIKIPGSEKPPDYIIDNQINNKFIIFPNPVNEYINISGFDESMPCLVIIYDMFGKEIFQSNNAVTIPIYQLPSGLYILSFIQGNKIITDKFIKN